MLPLALFALVAPPDTARLDAAVEAALARGDCPGAVLLVVHADAVVYRKAFGKRVLGESPESMTPDTVFDLASLTKPVATATSVWQLIERGKLRLDDPVAKYWPEFAANGKGAVTVEQCLLHTSGLTPDNSIQDYVGSRDDMLAKIAGLKLEAPAGTRFKYSDIGFIVLGELVGRVGGQPLDEFARANTFALLGLTATGYKPAEPVLSRVAPTGVRDGKPMVGVVHDPRAFALGGVAGHAGLFGSADDLERFARMLLRGGELDGVRVLKPDTVKLLTEPVEVPGGGFRSRGWDVDTGFSAPRGDGFGKRTGFGHTGFTGTSVWIDPPSKTAVVLLTSRLHPADDTKKSVTALRKEVGTLAAAIWANVPRPPSPHMDGSPTPVLSGLDVLRRDGFAKLAGKRVGLVTNHTGRTLDGAHVIDLLAAAPGVKLAALFSPEHGIRGELDEKVGDTTDAKTGLPVWSLYGEQRKPTAEQLKGLDVVVYDIQDIGCRFYTYISTLGLVMEAAADAGVPVLVLDRPNPIGGVAVAGPVRDAGKPSFVAFHDLPVRHGLTIGEMARLFAAERTPAVKLEVVACDGWRRRDTLDHTGQPWRNPSPNMRHLTAALLYPGVGLLETTNVSVGRGTERPFEWVGAPWLDGRKLAAELNARNLPGLRAVPVTRTPTSSVHTGKACGGVDLVVTDWAAMEPLRAGLELATSLRKLYPAAWETKGYDRLLVHKGTFDGVVAGTSAAELEKAWQPGLEAFQVRRRAALLYPD